MWVHWNATECSGKRQKNDTGYFSRTCEKWADMFIPINLKLHERLCDCSRHQLFMWHGSFCPLPFVVLLINLFPQRCSQQTNYYQQGVHLVWNSSSAFTFYLPVYVRESGSSIPMINSGTSFMRKLCKVPELQWRAGTTGNWLYEQPHVGILAQWVCELATLQPDFITVRPAA